MIPRINLECTKAEKPLRMHLPGTLFPKKDGVELVEYAEIIRCGECKYKPKCLHHDLDEGGIFGDNDFCSYGERRESEEENRE